MRRGELPQAYAYANGNPLSYTDPDGRYAKVCCSDTEVEISIPALVGTYGGSSLPLLNLYREEEVVDAIEAGWTGSFGGFNVTTKVSGGYDNFITILNEGPSGEAFLAALHPGAKFGLQRGNHIWLTWGASGPPKGGSNVAPHEVGHLLGLDHQTSDPANLMYDDSSNGNGFGVSRDQVEQILRSAGLRPGGCGCGVIP